MFLCYLFIVFIIPQKYFYAFKNLLFIEINFLNIFNISKETNKIKQLSLWASRELFKDNDNKESGKFFMTFHRISLRDFSVFEIDLLQGDYN